MKTYEFTLSQTIQDVRQALAQVNDPANKHLIAKVLWRTGPQADNDPLTYLWDPYAERFGHQLDKEMIDSQVVDSLMNGIPVEVQLVEPHHHKPA